MTNDTRDDKNAKDQNSGGAPAPKSKGGLSPFLNLVGDLLDKLTDVLNFGRILSIGIPGFVATYGVLMLLSLFTAPMPSRWVVRRGVASDTLDFAAARGSGDTAKSMVWLPTGSAWESKRALQLLVDSLKPRLGLPAESVAEFRTSVQSLVDTLKSKLEPLIDSARKSRTTVLRYYEQGRHVRLLDFVGRSRFQFDSTRVVGQWYFWFIGAIIIGSLISQWGYHSLRNRESMFKIWNEIIRSVKDPTKNGEGPRKSIQIPETSSDKRTWILGKPRTWRRLLATLDRVRELEPKWTGYDELLVKLQRARHGGTDEPSWSMVHLPLLRQNMITSQGITYWDHLTKEYWRFAEFAINCPAAAGICCLTLGFYFLALSYMYRSQASPLGILLVVLGLAVGLTQYLWWNPTVAFTSFNHYRLARSGLIAGLSIFPDRAPDVINPIQKMYTNCPEFRGWYCGAYQGKFNLERKPECKDPTKCLPDPAPPPTAPRLRPSSRQNSGPLAVTKLDTTRSSSRSNSC
jgi:hypothetical protein